MTTQQRYLKRVMYLGLYLTLLVGGLQMYHFPAGFLTNYGGDIAGPLLLYGAMRQGKTIFHHIWKHIPGPLFSGLSLFAACAAWEFCQLFNLAGTPLVITRGRFDPYDLITYAGTLAACYQGDRWAASGHTPSQG
jgi:hypothetical protein